MTTDKSHADALTAQVALAAIETFETGREYRFDGAVPNAKRDGVLPAWWRRPSIFMPSTARAHAVRSAWRVRGAPSIDQRRKCDLRRN
ncbi:MULTISPECIES: hypothetical protein [Burkholderia cepacia complex]|uniref:hypothetical protein n=1 Tax=Burkholderia cepacia complex TaxID=87882 RepID=UPI0020122488|nr:hypothetical protein [Burkholderia cenocepacia]